MAIVTGSTITYGVGAAGGNREDLEDVIWELDPLDTRCLTTFDRVKANATFHEWEIDTTVAPAANRQIEGNQESYSSITSPSRVGNYCQISSKEFLVSRTQDAIAKAGRKSDTLRQRKKQMRELKNDMEYAIVRNQASSAGGAGTARSLGSIESWIPTTDNGGNGVRATTSAAASTAGFSSGVVAAPTDGTTTGALTEAKFKEALSLAWIDGGDPSMVLVETTQKTAISAFSGNTTKTTQIPNAKDRYVIQTSADFYVSEYGVHELVLHRHVRASVVLCLDPEYWATAFIDEPFMEEMAKTSDGRKTAMRAEFTLVCRNHAANGKVVACA